MAIWRDVFYRCAKCGSMVMKFGTQGELPSCCGEAMGTIEPFTEDNPGAASSEKHLPVMKRGRIITVSVGDEDNRHPMDPDHYIDWIYISTEMGAQLVKLRPGIEPYAQFALNGDIPLNMYAYCNKHGLWATEVFESMQDDDE